MVRRINLFGGPGSGKSTTAAMLFSELKQQQFSVELVSEYIKTWSYQNRKVNSFDQIYIFGKQHQYEYRFLSNGVKTIITDSPCFLSAIYAEYFGSPEMGRAIKDIHNQYEKEFESFNIILDRGDKPYDTAGRWQSHEEAKELDKIIETEVKKNFSQSRVMKIPFNKKSEILNDVMLTILFEGEKD